MDNTQLVLDIEQNNYVYIDPNSINSTDSSINLFGENISELAVSLNENFIRIMQTFYGVDAPQAPLIGQQWFNKNDLTTYRWLGENWVQIDQDITFDCLMFIKFNITETEFVIDESVFNFTIENIILYNQDMQEVKFTIDSFDSKKIILKESNVTTLYILIFHPKDRITNPFKNKKIEIIATSGQTQFDIESFLIGTNVNTLSVDINGIMLKNNEFTVTNNILTIDGKVYRIKENDKITIWKQGGSLSNYYSNLHITINERTKKLKIPKFFKSIVDLQIFDKDNKVVINPIEVNEMDDYIEFEFLDKKLISSNVKLRII